MNEPREITWRLHLKSPPRTVHAMLTTDTGRQRFWAEKSIEKDGQIDFRFIDGMTLTCRILENNPSKRFTFEYFGGSIVTIELTDDGAGGTDLTLHAQRVRYAEEWPGWVSVLLALKAAVDYSIDIRNHDVERTWD
jgi:uncharacterized protein YndB with AHSA1/START domain